jgi:hypothetical protein
MTLDMGDTAMVWRLDFQIDLEQFLDESDFAHENLLEFSDIVAISGCGFESQKVPEGKRPVPCSAGVTMGIGTVAGEGRIRPLWDGWSKVTG